MPKTTAKTYRGRYAGHTYGQFAADAARALPEGWLPVSLAWEGETLLDVVFERSGPVDASPDQEASPFDRRSWPAYRVSWPTVAEPVLVIVACAVLGWVVAVVVTSLLAR